MLITGWSKGVDWVSFFHNVCQMQQVLQKQEEPGRASPREPCHMGPPLAHSCPSWNPRPPGMASRLTHKRTHAHTHCAHHALKGIRGPSPGKTFFTKGVKEFASIGRTGRIRKKINKQTEKKNMG